MERSGRKSSPIENGTNPASLSPLADGEAGEEKGESGEVGEERGERGEKEIEEEEEREAAGGGR